MASTKEINPERLRQLRSKMKLSQKELSGRIDVDVGTLSRWERGEVTRLRRSSVGKLCDVLNATEAELCGDGPLSDARASRPELPQDQLNLIINTACRNAMALVAKRYDVTRQQIVEIAPLLFHIVAEESLQKREQALRDTEELMQAAEAACPSHLSPDIFYRDDDDLEAERESIKARDLFADVVTMNTGHEIPATDNPFATFLAERLAPFSPFKKDSKKFRAVDWDGGDPLYFICRDEIMELVGGNKDAIKLILTGQVGLHEMPGEIRRSTPEAKAQWVLDRYREMQQQSGCDSPEVDELLDSLPEIFMEMEEERDRLRDPHQLQNDV